MRILNLRSALILFLASVYHTHLSANIEIPDFYNEPGSSDSREGSIGSIYDVVDPFSGQLSISHTDLSIPGNGGFDLNITRAYSTHRAKSAFRGKSLIGHGWDLHMGRIHFDGPLSPGVCLGLKANQFSTSNPVLELPDGSKKLFVKPKYVYSSIGSDGTEQRKFDFITKDYWIADCHDYATKGITVTSPQGVRASSLILMRLAGCKSLSGKA
jgi:hypothetical protein